MEPGIGFWQHGIYTWKYDQYGQKNSSHYEDLMNDKIEYRRWSFVGDEEQIEEPSLTTAGITDTAFLYGCVEDEEIPHTFIYST